MSAVAEAERDQTRERITDVKRDQRQRGRYLGGKAPLGYRVGDAGELIEIPEQQAALARMRRLRAKGASLRGIEKAMAEAEAEDQPCRCPRRARGGGAAVALSVTPLHRLDSLSHRGDSQGYPPLHVVRWLK